MDRDVGSRLVYIVLTAGAAASIATSAPLTAPWVSSTTVSFPDVVLPAAPKPATFLIHTEARLPESYELAADLQVRIRLDLHPSAPIAETVGFDLLPVLQDDALDHGDHQDADAREESSVELADGTGFCGSPMCTRDYELTITPSGNTSAATILVTGTVEVSASGDSGSTAEGSAVAEQTTFVVTVTPEP